MLVERGPHIRRGSGPSPLRGSRHDADHGVHQRSINRVGDRTGIDCRHRCTGRVRTAARAWRKLRWFGRFSLPCQRCHSHWCRGGRPWPAAPSVSGKPGCCAIRWGGLPLQLRTAGSQTKSARWHRHVSRNRAHATWWCCEPTGHSPRGVGRDLAKPTRISGHSVASRVFGQCTWAVALGIWGRCFWCKYSLVHVPGLWGNGIASSLCQAAGMAAIGRGDSRGVNAAGCGDGGQSLELTRAPSEQGTDGRGWSVLVAAAPNRYHRRGSQQPPYVAWTRSHT